MALAAYSVGCLFCAAVIAYTMRWQGATLYWGKRLTPANPYLPRGSQDAITPPIQTVRNLVMWLGLAALAVIGLFLFQWYIVVIAVAAVWLTSGFIAIVFMPAAESSYFRDRIRRSLVKRGHGYTKSGDDLRAALVQELVEAMDTLEQV